ncbi:hypothetical protein SO802_018411 [Lithocarpus litseifolius]|uniref:RRM domain-containing protein n=1 Tax=Lithocarpus litseifolius TaxID=425828 RepID=A0AAW2CMS9_9ROSI
MTTQDSLYWPLSQDGRHSCKTSYTFLKEEADLNFHEDHSEHDKKLWKGIWALNSPNKVKHFIWRACRNGLPTKENLLLSAYQVVEIEALAATRALEFALEVGVNHAIVEGDSEIVTQTGFRLIFSNLNHGTGRATLNLTGIKSTLASASPEPSTGSLPIYKPTFLTSLRISIQTQVPISCEIKLYSAISLGLCSINSYDVVLQKVKVFSLSFTIQAIQVCLEVIVKVKVEEPVKDCFFMFWARYGRSPSSDVENPGNNLYVTGLSPRVTKRELEKHFAIEGTVVDVHLVVDPWTRESRGFGFVTMATLEEADRCIKHLNNSVIEGRVITVEKARRRRGRTPTPGRYLGLRTIRVRRRTPSHSSRRSPSYSPYRRGRSRSPRYSSERSRSRSYSPYYVRQRSYSPYYSRRSYSPYYSRRSYSRRRTRSPYYSRRRSYSRSASPSSQSPVSQRDQSYSPYDSRYGYRSVSRSMSPRPRRSRRSYSRSVSPRPRRSSRRSYSRSVSPKGRTSRSYSRSISPKPRSTKSRSHGVSSGHGYSRSYSRSPSGSVSPSSRSISRSRSASASSRSPSR